MVLSNEVLINVELSNKALVKFESSKSAFVRSHSLNFAYLSTPFFHLDIYEDRFVQIRL